MDYESYRDETVSTAVALVNLLTPGTDGTRAVVVPEAASGRRSRAHRVPVLADRRLSGVELAGLVELGGRCRPVFEACGVGDIDRAARNVNDLLELYRSAPRLIRHDGQPWHLHFHSEGVGVVIGWGAGCATGLAIVIGSGHGDRLGTCTADPCDRVYVDTSRNGNRRFCSPRCANRYTVAAHRARSRR